MSMKRYRVTLVERVPPPQREGMTYVVEIVRPSRRAALRGWYDRFAVVSVGRISAVTGRVVEERPRPDLAERRA